MAELINTDEQLKRILESTESMAVIGMKTEGPAHYVPQMMTEVGYSVVPVSPKYDTIDGLKAFSNVAEIETPIDMVVLFRRSEAIPSHVDEILALSPRPATVWMQLGIANASAAEQFVAAGIDVVQDRCLKIEYTRLM